MKGFRVLKSGLLTTIQDGGRPGFRKYGMPLSGALDNYSFRIANLLVGNRVSEATLEATLIGPTIEFLSKTLFAVTGAEMNPMLNGKSISNWEGHLGKKGDILTLSMASSGARCYISFAGGIDIPLIMGSGSTYLKGAIGGFAGRKLMDGDIVNLYPFGWLGAGGKSLPANLIPAYSEEVVLRYTRGRDFNEFEGRSIALFSGSLYTVSPESDRMGYRLAGPIINHSSCPDVLSYAVVPGTIQVPGDGKPILMMNDCQTTGGYTQIANIITTDQSLAGQLRPGNKIRFELVDVKIAMDALTKEREALTAFFGKRKAVICTDCYRK